MQVFECQHCQRPFQVSQEHAGQQVQCPACQQVVTIPADAFSQQPAPESRTQVFACPQCDGQFQVRPSGQEQTVSCPHCQRSVMIPADPGMKGPQVQTGVRRRSPKTSANRGLPEFQVPQDNPDLFAPTRPPEDRSRKKSKSKPKPGASGGDEPAVDTGVGKAGPKLPPPQPPRKPSRPAKTPAPKPAAGTGAPQPSGTAGKKSRPEPPRPELPKPPSAVVAASQPPSADRTQSESSTESEETATPPTSQVQPIDHLLPPRFDVEDPEQLAIRVGRSQTKVLLPDASGGTAEIDQRIVRVQHGDEVVSLVVLSPEQRARRRFIRNLVTIAIAIAAMAIAFAALR